LPIGIIALLGDGIQVGSDSRCDDMGRRERVTPNSEHPPASPAKQPGHAAVAGNVAGDFALPIFAVSKRHAAVPYATMPEAPINEDSHALTGKNKVRSAGKQLVAAPSGDSGGTKNGD